MSLPIVLTAAAGGVVSHLGFFIRGEHHLQGPTLLSMFLVVPPILCLCLVELGGNDLYDAVMTSTMIVSAYITALFTSMAVYRWFFHHLNSFPGPPMARLTKFYHLFSVAKKRDNYLWLEKCRQEYGEFVRIGPNELSIFTPEAIQVIHGPGSRFSKSSWYDGDHPSVSLQTTRDKVAHDKRRRIWDQGFSSKALHGYEARITQYTQQLSDQIAASAEKPVNVTKWFNFFAFDVMGDLAFGKPFNMLNSGESHFAVTVIREGMGMIGFFSSANWLFYMIGSIPGLSRQWDNTKAWCAEQLQHRIKANVDQPDVMSSIIRWTVENNRLEADKDWLDGDAVLIVVAGSDTTASALTFLFYHLAQDPTQVEKLRDELSDVENVSDSRELQGLPHLNGLITETLRLHPPVPSGVQRLSPPDGATIAGQYIPGETLVVTPIYSLARLESCFEKADEFIPERWSSRPEMVKDKNAFMPFNIGRYGCVGKQLAMMEMRGVVAKLITEYDVSFALGEDGTDLLTNTKDVFTTAPGKLELVFKAR